MLFQRIGLSMPSPFWALQQWSQQHFVDLPWRRKRTLYRTWVSEVMLQQTTVGTVSSRFDDFLQKFPDIKSLATAPEEAVLSAWRGLGYYRRAINLHKGAQYLVQNHQGQLPTDESALMSIPGIGEYTAAALMAIGRNRPALPLDANLKRVLARYHGLESTQLKKELQQRFSDGTLFPDMASLGPRALIEALMDLGRVHCRANSVRCDECPLSTHCLAHQKGRALSYGRPAKSAPPILSLVLLRVVVKEKGKIIAYPKQAREWLSGQWELPTFVLHSEDDKLSQYPPLPTPTPPPPTLPRITSHITRYRIDNHILSCPLKYFRQTFPFPPDWKLYDPLSTPSLLSSTTLKILDKINYH